MERGVCAHDLGTGLQHNIGPESKEIREIKRAKRGKRRAKRGKSLEGTVNPEGMEANIEGMP